MEENKIIAIAKLRRSRKYITPDDVTDALKDARFTTPQVRLNLLEIMGKQTGFGITQPALCAYLAWKGKE